MPLRHALESILHNQIRFGKGTLDITALHIKLHGDVTLFIFVDEWGAFFHGLFGVEDRGKLIPLNVDQVHGLFSDVPVDSRYGCDFFAHVTGFTFREGVLVGKKRPPAPFDGILSGYHGSNTSHFFCLAGIDLDNPGMGIGTAKDFSDQHPWNYNVRDEAAFPGDPLESFKPADLLSHHGEFFPCSFLMP